MIKLIGIRRAILLLALLAVNALIAAVYLLGIGPLSSETENNLNAMNAQIADTSSKIQNIKAELDAYPGNFSKYKELERRGFFLPQDRFQTSRSLDELREKSGLLGYAYKIEAIEAVSNPDAANGNSSLINSRITLDHISSTLDMNVYTLMYNLATIFPQHTRIQSFSIAKTRPVDENTLRDVAGGKSGFVDATIVMDWLTVVPKTTDAAAAGPGGFRRQ